MGGFFVGFLWFVYIMVCLLLMVIVLIQRGETGGLSSAFGGGGGETAFGTKADMTWKKATAWFAGIFMLLAIVLGSLMSNRGSSSLTGQGEAPAPAGPAAPG
ncbi:MAG TPA: preprotein translocase subunit SecG, partial [Planctomycetota bacterium]|nr:preprotein translocase subunit SecG [Planctomycetota bacterium]